MEFVQRTFVEGKTKGSKVVTCSRGAEIATYLARSVDAVQDARFKFWVQSCGFKLMDYPVLVLKNILYLPTKKVCALA